MIFDKNKKNYRASKFQQNSLVAHIYINDFEVKALALINIIFKQF